MLSNPHTDILFHKFNRRQPGVINYAEVSYSSKLSVLILFQHYSLSKKFPQKDPYFDYELEKGAEYRLSTEKIENHTLYFLSDLKFINLV